MNNEFPTNCFSLSFLDCHLFHVRVFFQMSVSSWLCFYTGDHCCSTGDSKLLLENASWLLLNYFFILFLRISVLNGNWEGRTVWIIFTSLWRKEGFTLYVALLITSGGRLAHSTKCEQRRRQLLRREDLGVSEIRAHLL